jgi:hypothetical protein
MLASRREAMDAFEPSGAGCKPVMQGAFLPDGVLRAHGERRG